MAEGKETGLEHIFDMNLEPDKGQEEWHQKRLGKFTSSRFADMMTTGRAKNERYGQSAIKYIYEKIAEILTAQPHVVTSQSMDWGTQMEAAAITLYEEKTGNKVEYTGFLEFGSYAGGTPDGLVGEDGVIEAKCPFNPANHIQTIIENQVPNQYQFQVQGNLMVTGRKWCDFISYDPRVNEDSLKLHVIRVERDEAIILAIQERIAEVTEKLNELLNQIK